MKSKIRFWWTGRKERQDEREEAMREVQVASDEVKNARRGLEQVLRDLSEKRRGLNA